MKLVREIVNAFVDGGHLVQLYKKENGRVYAHREEAQYVSYLRTRDIPIELGRELRNSRYVKGLKAEGQWCRVSWTDWNARNAMTTHPESPIVKAGVEVFEGDVDPVRRHFTDHDTPIATPRRCYLDIETDSRVPFSKKEEMRILSWAVVCDETGETWSGLLEEWSDAAERRLIEAMWRALQPFDQVVAWYGDGFDFPVIFARSGLQKLATDARRWLWLDHKEAFQRFNTSSESGDEKRSMKLEDIGQSVTGKGKTKAPQWVTDRFGDKSLGALAYDLWEAGGEFRQLLLDYNIQDTRLLREIEQETGYLELFGTLCEVCRLFPNTASLNPTHQVDGFMLRLGKQRGYHFPTKKFRENVVKFKGAFVMQPESLDAEWRIRHGMHDGIARNVHVCDFSGMYPSIILSWNMSPDTKALDGTLNGPIPPGMCRTPLTGVCFRTGTEGILPTALREMIRLRKYYNDLKASLAPGTSEWHEADRLSTAYKVAANSFYGVIGSPFSRYFDKSIAESVTQAGVWLLKQTMHEAEQRGFISLYGDTDSAFIMGAERGAFADFVRWCNADLYPKLLAQQGCAVNEIKLAYEKEFDRIVFTSAKRYCNPPEAPIWMGDMTFKPLGEIKVGDEIVGWSDGEWVSKNKKRRLARARVVAVHRHVAPILKLTMASGRTIRCTADHRWLHARRSTRANGCQFITPKVGRELAHVVDPSPELGREQERDAAWLGGIYDGEGSLCSSGRGQIVISQSDRVNPEVCKRLRETMDRLGFDFHEWEQKRGNCKTFAIRGRRQARVDFVNWCRPAKAEKIVNAIFGHRFTDPDRIVSIEEDGEGEVIGLTTTTGNYVAWGYASKNCGSYRHYKWKTTCTCTTAKGDPGSLDVKTMTCKDCGTVHDVLPPSRSKPEIKGLEYKRGDVLKMAATLQAEMIDLLVGGLGLHGPDSDLPTTDLEQYHGKLSRIRQRILEGPLALDDVKQSKGLSKSLKEYVSKTKQDDTPAAQPPQVQVAHILKARGQDVREGTRIDYFVVDGNVSPMKVAPAEDWAGECDRYYLWESLVYPATQRLLESAFPDHDWQGWAKVRPPKVRVTKASRALEGQGSLFDPITTR